MIDDLSNGVGADPAEPEDGKSRGGVRDIFKKYAKQYKEGQDNQKPQGLKDYFSRQAKKKAGQYALKKGKNYLENTERGKKIGAKGKEFLNKVDDKTGGLAGKLNRAGFVPTADPNELKRQAREYMKGEGKDAIKEAINNRFKSGAGDAVKEGSKDLVKQGAKEGAEELAKQGVKEGAKIGADAAIDGGLELAAEGLGAAGAIETLGISEVLAQLIVIAISLGISDAIDGAIELAKGHPKKAIHYFTRAVTKIIVFVLFLISIIICGSILPIIGVTIPLIGITAYWVLGSAPFLKDMAIMQGLVWWEKILIAVMDIAAIFYISLAVLVTLYIWCNIGSLGGTAVAGSVGGAIGGLLDKATTSQGSYCTAFQGALTSGAGSNSSGTSSPGTVKGDETVGSFTPPGGSCKFSGVNLCQGVVGGYCSNASKVAAVQGYSSQINDAIQKYGPIPGVPNSAAFISAIMTQESGGDPNAESGTGASGLMQFTTAAANTYGPQCSSSYNSSVEWRKSHPTEQICMAVKYFQSIAAGQCGQPRVEVRNLAAGYNRGPGYCRPADGTYTSCTGNGCDGTPIKSWECLWTDSGHTSCNAYVVQGQQYAQYVFGCYTKFAGGGN